VRPPFSRLPNPDHRRPREGIAAAPGPVQPPFLHREDDIVYSVIAQTEATRELHWGYQVIASEGRRLATDAISVHYAAPSRIHQSMLYEGLLTAGSSSSRVSTAQCVMRLRDAEMLVPAR